MAEDNCSSEPDKTPLKVSARLYDRKRGIYSDIDSQTSVAPLASPGMSDNITPSAKRMRRYREKLRAKLQYAKYLEKQRKKAKEYRANRSEEQKKADKEKSRLRTQKYRQKKKEKGEPVNANPTVNTRTKGEPVSANPTVNTRTSLAAKRKKERERKRKYRAALTPEKRAAINLKRSLRGKEKSRLRTQKYHQKKKEKGEPVNANPTVNTRTKGEPVSANPTVNTRTSLAAKRKKERERKRKYRAALTPEKRAAINLKRSLRGHTPFVVSYKERSCFCEACVTVEGSQFEGSQFEGTPSQEKVIRPLEQFLESGIGINIGQQLPRWNALKDQLQLETNESLAKHLMDYYCKGGTNIHHPVISDTIGVHSSTHCSSNSHSKLYPRRQQESEQNTFISETVTDTERRQDLEHSDSIIQADSGTTWEQDSVHSNSITHAVSETKKEQDSDHSNTLTQVVSETKGQQEASTNTQIIPKTKTDQNASIKQVDSSGVKVAGKKYLVILSNSKHPNPTWLLSP
ncbi:uncharacterized protein LOC106173273 isoform X2 [Lingula anatina]|uniref:Uncharacterized protein LOC106173273 isoform X2 n=1 Tax=Lingula anatina TaxID=7574 RepID=A0A1S3JHG2_LINAN|nr:uncharacterized protein LOC106173273 isoform X2 [Lingula anatina]|eukprot:XP_013409798.1 uncharacterized protein LOC106173273 isoform X2 [Lingula anatina]